MPRSRTAHNRSPSPWFLTLREQKLVGPVVLLAQAALLGTWIYWQRHHQLGDIDHQPRRGMLFLIDINTAEAAELALLPDIGPTLAARIVAWRKEHGPFRSVDDVCHVHGIGPKTFERMRPHLAPLSEPDG